ncbi:MAG: DNA methyltransferase [Patescibacteria group bacterium]
MKKDKQLKIEYITVEELKSYEQNPRLWSEDATKQLKESIKRFGVVDPLIVNSAPDRKNIVLGGNFRLLILKEMGIKIIPIVYINITDTKKEKELVIRLNKNIGTWDYNLLKEFDEGILSDIGFNSEELDEIFDIESEPEKFDLQKELEKLNIKNIEMKKGQIWQLDKCRIMIGDSTIRKDIEKLMSDEKADMCLTDPPYILDYLKGKKKNGKPTEGFGYKRDRKYLETDILPDDFTEKWISNISKIQKESFSIICYENWKNLRIIWNEMEKYWKIKNMIVWHLPNRTQGFAAKYKFFSKHDIAMVGVSKKHSCELNTTNEEELLEEEYRTALFAISGKPHWEGYKKGKKYTPTDFIEYKASDEKSSGQGIIFGTKPLEILIPYIKVLTKRNDLIIEPFGGSGSTLIASYKMKRRCYLMEKSPIYAEVIRNRWEKFSGKKAKLIKN